MAGYCVSFLFYTYVSGTIIYFLLAIFASTGNLPLLMEHYKYDSVNNALIEDDEKNVKSRTLSQYFLGSFLTLVISVVLYIFCIREKPQDKGLFTQTISLDMHQDNNILNQPENETIRGPIELARPDSIQNENDNNNKIQAINTVNTLDSGMGENEI